MTTTTDAPRYPVDFEERLLSALLVVQAGPSPSPAGGGRRSHHALPSPRGVLALVAAVAAAAIAVAIVVPPAANRVGRHPAPHTPPTTPLATATWRLTGDISPPAWGLRSASADSFARGLACPTSSFCVWDGVGGPTNDVGVIMVSHDAGATWQQAYTAGGHLQLLGATCPSVTTCMVTATSTGLTAAGTTELIVTHDAGATWEPVPLPTTRPNFAVSTSCATDADCVVIGSTYEGSAHLTFAEITSDGGATWLPSTLPSGFFPVSLKCFTTERCVTTGYETQRPTVGAAAYSTDGGRIWSISSLPPGTTPIGALSCAAVSGCVATTIGQQGTTHGVNAVLVSHDGGAYWSKAEGIGIEATSTPIGVTVVSLSCPTSTECWAAGTLATPTTAPNPTVLTKYGKYHTFQADMLVTVDGGNHWSAVSLPAPPGQSLAFANLVSCAPSETACFAGAVAHGTSSTEIVLSAVDPSTEPR